MRPDGFRHRDGAVYGQRDGRGRGYAGNGQRYQMPRGRIEPEYEDYESECNEEVVKMITLPGMKSGEERDRGRGGGRDHGRRREEIDSGASEGWDDETLIGSARARSRGGRRRRREV